LQWFTRLLAWDGRSLTGFYLLWPIKQAIQQAALTVAGQWRSCTAFPNILTIAVMCTLFLKKRSSHYVMKRYFMTSTFIDGQGEPSQKAPS
jgi:hypothetical protein